MYMTPYKKFYYYIIRCLNHFFFSQEKETLHQRKSAARLGRLRLQGALAPRSFHHEAWLHDEKSPTTFPLTLCTTVKIDILSFYLFNLLKKKVFQ